MPSSKGLFVLITISIIVFSIAASAGFGRFIQSSGPEGGAVLALVVDPSDPRIVYAGLAGAGVYRSLDGAATWRAVNQGLPPRAGGSALAMDPTSPETLYVVGHGAVYRSTNRGDHWEPVSLPETEVWAGKLIVDPTDPGTLYAAAADQGVLKSTDGAAEWVEANTGLPEGVYAETIVLAPSDPAVLYLGVRNRGVFKSVDGAETWAEADEGLPFQTTVTALLVDPGDPQVLYAGTHFAVHKSTDGGESWSFASEGMGVAGIIQAFAMDPTDSGILYAGTYTGRIFRSVDGAEVWSEISSGLPGVPVYALAVDPVDPETVYGGTTTAGVFKSVDAGAAWSPTSRGLVATPVRTVAVAPTDSTTVYAGVFGGGVFKSSNRGATWRPTNSGLTNLFVEALAVDPTDGRTLYAGTSMAGLFKSVDGAESWAPLPFFDAPEEVAPRVNILTIDLADPRVLYAGTQGGGGMFKSSDGGESWTESNTGLPQPVAINSLAIDPNDTRTLYAVGSAPGFFKSADGGESWDALGEGLPAGALALVVDPADSRVLYAGTNFGAFKSTDGGANWTEINEGFRDVPGGRHVWALAIDPENPRVLYAGTLRGVYRSADAGATWVSLGMEEVILTTLAVDPAEPWAVYAGTENEGVFRSFPTLTFAQFAEGEGVFSQVLLANAGEDASAAILDLRDAEGAPMTVRLDGELVAGSQTLEIPRHGLIAPTSDGASGLLTGSLTVSSQGPLAGVVLFGGDFGLAGVGASVPLLGTFLVPVEADQDRGIDTGLAVMNLENRPVTLAAELLTADGAALSSAELTLPALGQRALHATEFEWDVPLDPTGFLGVMRLKADGWTSATAIQTRPGQFATMPVGDASANAAGAGDEGGLHFAQIADGGGLFSQVLLINLREDSATPATLHFRDGDGNPMTIELDGNEVAGSESVEVPAAGLVALTTGGVGEVRRGSLTVESEGPLAGVVVFGGDFGLAGVGTSRAREGGFGVPIEVDPGRGVETGLAVMNLEDRPTTVRAELLGSDGTALSSAELILPALGQDALLATEFEWESPVDLDGFRGVMRLGGDGRTAATAIQVRPGQFATLPVVDLDPVD